ncbi:MAG: type II toxin-antitoxin system prevent-host-death family antitoxin [Vulcanimicrobiota bacterium]
MESINIRQAREKLSELISSAEQGESIAITRYGKKVALLGPIQPEGYRLPDLREFRTSIRPAEQVPTSAVLELRETERY